MRHLGRHADALAQRGMRVYGFADVHRVCAHRTQAAAVRQAEPSIAHNGSYRKISGNCPRATLQVRPSQRAGTSSLSGLRCPKPTLDLHVNGLCGGTSTVWTQDADFFGTEEYQPKMKHADSGPEVCTKSV
jgi:hypothetical protein